MATTFEPQSEPARSIYRAFIEEATKRHGREPEVWLVAERQAVLAEAVVQAAKRGLRMPTLNDVILAEDMATGHTDYGAKWAWGVVEAMQR